MHSSVQSLDLPDNSIGDAGAAAIAELLESPGCRVTSLQLSDNCITDAGMIRLAQVGLQQCFWSRALCSAAVLNWHACIVHALLSCHGSKEAQALGSAALQVRAASGCVHMISSTPCLASPVFNTPNPYLDLPPPPPGHTVQWEAGGTVSLQQRHWVRGLPCPDSSSGGLQAPEGGGVPARQLCSHPRHQAAGASRQTQQEVGSLVPKKCRVRGAQRA